MEYRTTVEKERQIRVLVIDDSALVRQILTEILQQDRAIEVVGAARDPYEARDKIKRLHPDVLTLDVEMPKMDGLTFLRNLMRLRPMPVVMVSALTQKGSETTLDALALGAIDFVAKPTGAAAGVLGDYAEEIIAKVKIASAARVREQLPTFTQGHEKSARRSLQRGQRRDSGRLVAIGASTGGTEAIREILEHLPADSPPVVITQHIPATFSRTFAERMNRCSAMTVTEARQGEVILPGHVYIAPGNRHLQVVRQGDGLYCRLADDAPVNRHRPSVDVMFHSVLESVGHKAVAVLLTGMGQDGARGMLALRQVGACTLAQNEASSIVWGMPGEAVALDAVDEQVDLSRMASRILQALEVG